MNAAKGQKAASRLTNESPRAVVAMLSDLMAHREQRGAPLSAIMHCSGAIARVLQSCTNILRARMDCHASGESKLSILPIAIARKRLCAPR